MANILTITVNPSLDLYMETPRIISEKKTRCTDAKYDPGGGGINVARALRSLGHEAKAFFPSGGPTGAHLRLLLTQAGIDFDTFETDSLTRQDVAVRECETGNLYRFVAPGNPLRKEDADHLHHEIMKRVIGYEYVVLSGSLLPGLPVDLFRHVSRAVRDQGGQVVLDTSGAALFEGIQGGVDLLRVNKKEFVALKKCFIERRMLAHHIDDEAFEKFLTGSGFCRVFIRTLGEKGAILRSEHESYRVIPPKVMVKSCVGAGDSFVAGVVLAISQRRSLREALRYGMAAAVAALGTPGTGLCKREGFEAALKEIREGPADTMVA